MHVESGSAYRHEVLVRMPGDLLQEEEQPLQDGTVRVRQCTDQRRYVADADLQRHLHFCNRA